jgi:hypothetical protein
MTEFRVFLEQHCAAMDLHAQWPEAAVGNEGRMCNSECGFCVRASRDMDLASRHDACDGAVHHLLQVANRLLFGTVVAERRMNVSIDEPGRRCHAFAIDGNVRLVGHAGIERSDPAIVDDYRINIRRRLIEYAGKGLSDIV